MTTAPPEGFGRRRNASSRGSWPSCSSRARRSPAATPFRPHPSSDQDGVGPAASDREHRTPAGLGRLVL